MKTTLRIYTEQPAIEDLKRISVKICKRDGDATPILLGTGTIVCDGVDFYVLTAAHCFRDKEGIQNCQEDEIVLTMFDDKGRAINLDVKGVDLSDTEMDTAIVSIKTPPGGYGFYYEKLKLLGKELDGYGYVFGYTRKQPQGRMFTYKRVNTHTWANQDSISEKGDDFYKMIKGSSGGGMLVGINDRVYCMGFVRSTFDEESTLDDVLVQPVNLFKSKWNGAYFPTIEDAIGESNLDSSGSELQQECINAWRDVYDAILRNDSLDGLLPRIKKIRELYSIPKSINHQNDVMMLLFRRGEPWTEDHQDLFLMALEDQGLWPSIYGAKISAVSNGIFERPLAKKLEKRAVTLTQAPYYETQALSIKDSENYYEQILRYAYTLDFSCVKQMATSWDAEGFWIARKALFVSLFEKNKDVLAALNKYLKDSEYNNQNEKFIATVVYNVINDDFSDRKSYKPFLDIGLDGISTVLTDIAERIEMHHSGVSVYGVHQRYLIGGEDTVSIPEAMRLLRSIIDAGILTSFKMTYFLSQEKWLKVVKCLFSEMPYPILFYTLMYTDEKLLKRVGQEYAYTDDEDVRTVLPDIQTRVLKAIGNGDTPNIYIGLYSFSSELYIALCEDIWYELFRDNVLMYFCQNQVAKNVSHHDPIYKNICEGVRCVRKLDRRIEIFGLLTSVLSSNSYLVSALIHDYLLVDEDLMNCDEFRSMLMTVIKDHPLKETYTLASKYGREKDVDDKFLVLIDEVVKRDGLDFGSETSKAVCLLSHVVRDDAIKAQMRDTLLRYNIWDCGIYDSHYTAPRPIGIETVDKNIGWSVADWEIIKGNMLSNMALIEQESQKHPSVDLHFGREYIALLCDMRYFIKNIQQIEGCAVQSVIEKIDCLLIVLRKHKNVMAELSSVDYDSVVDGVWSLRDMYLDEGIERCKPEILLLINRIMMQEPVALENCLSLLSALIVSRSMDMTMAFGRELLDVLSKYAELDYSSLFVRKPEMYKWLRRIANGLVHEYGNEAIVRYWLEDPLVNRFNYVDEPTAMDS